MKKLITLTALLFSLGCERVTAVNPVTPTSPSSYSVTLYRPGPSGETSNWITVDIDYVYGTEIICFEDLETGKRVYVTGSVEIEEN